MEHGTLQELVQTVVYWVGEGSTQVYIWGAVLTTNWFKTDYFGGVEDNRCEVTWGLQYEQLLAQNKVIESNFEQQS